MAICLCGQPGGSGGPVIPSLFGLASSGVCPAGALPRPPVSSYLTISPWPRRTEVVCFCGTFRRVASPRLVSLPGAVPYEVRTFLPRPASRAGAATRPTPLALWRTISLMRRRISRGVAWLWERPLPLAASVALASVALEMMSKWALKTQISAQDVVFDSFYTFIAWALACRDLGRRRGTKSILDKEVADLFARKRNQK